MDEQAGSEGVERGIKVEEAGGGDNFTVVERQCIAEHVTYIAR